MQIYISVPNGKKMNTGNYGYNSKKTKSKNNSNRPAPDSKLK